MLKILPCLTLLLPLVSGAYAQATDPTPFDMSGGATFTLNAYDLTTFPDHMAVGSRNGNTDGNFLNQVATDAIYGTAAGEWSAESTNGISYRGNNSLERGSFLLALNTTNRQDVTVSWTVNDISTGPNTNFIEIQYRLGNSGAFTNLDNDLYQQGTTPSGTSFTLQLPGDAADQPVVQLRWIYYEVGSGGRDRLAIDDISVSSVVLPITLTRFDAQAEGNSVQLAWETETELNNARFLIERSADGHNFRSLESMTGAGTTTVRQAYCFTDESPLPGRSYYRLQQVDFDGRASFSPVRQVTRSAGGIRLAPTLARQTITVTVALPFREEVRWTILDAGGQVADSGVWPPETTDQTLEISRLRPGNYFFRLGDFSGQFVKD